MYDVCWYVRETFCYLLTFYILYVKYRMSDVVFVLGRIMIFRRLVLNM